MRRSGRILSGLSRFAARDLTVDEEIYESASAANHHNRELTRLLFDRDRLFCEPDAALDLDTRQSCLAVTARDLALMGVTLADGGVSPVTRDRVVREALCHHVLAVMSIAGLYETSGDWKYTSPSTMTIARLWRSSQAETRPSRTCEDLGARAA